MSPQQNKAFEVVRASNYFSMTQPLFITFVTIWDGQFIFKMYTFFFCHVHFFFILHTTGCCISASQKLGRTVYKAVKTAGYHQPVFQDDQAHFSFYQETFTEQLL